MPVTLLIARHGNTFAPGEAPRRVGLTDLPLVESGITQGYRLGEYLTQQQLIPDVIFTSSLQRTMQTAQAAQCAMQTHLALQVEPMFNEIDYGPDENQPEPQVIARIGTQALADWDLYGQVPPGWRVNPQALIESWHAFAEKLQHHYTNQTILVITSNGIARFAPYLTGDFAAFSAQHNIKLATGAVSVFHSTAKPRQWTCQQWNIKPGSIVFKGTTKPTTPEKQTGP